MNQRQGQPKEELDKRQKPRTTKTLPHWKVEDGILTYDGKGDSLQTVKDYGDFELLRGLEDREERRQRHLPPRPAAGADLGLGQQPGAQARTRTPGPAGCGTTRSQGQDAKSVGKIPLKKADKPVGEWNTFHIIMKGDKVTVQAQRRAGRR